MTRIDFYISNNNNDDARARLACRVAEKAYQTKHSVYVHVDDKEQAEQLDQLLWTFRDRSFVPHCLSGDPHCGEAAVIIGYGDTPAAGSPEVLINISNEVPGFFSRYERVAEIVGGDENYRQKARERFKFYRERGYPLETHELSS
jgi:DNA polymerase-3 subunit chi